MPNFDRHFRGMRRKIVMGRSNISKYDLEWIERREYWSGFSAGFMIGVLISLGIVLLAYTL